METLMAQLSSTYGEEDPTYAIFFTITSCRQLKQRFGGVSPYVVVRVGIDAYQTKVVKDCTEPDYFELSEFYIDRPYEEVISIIVMDRYDIGNDQEIGHADIPLKDLRIG
ncbi:C2 domain containing protein, putative [Angomonas deanei]|uniref:C2 domain containing protein, putative n=1 Tax=Angomonas deanei TaxID=59799 RepID=A0A7G2BZM4_9TRYP|nr:C2 domain containing protein, putative [Angomonas deanei]